MLTRVGAAAATAALLALSGPTAAMAEPDPTPAPTAEPTKEPEPACTLRICTGEVQTWEDPPPAADLAAAQQTPSTQPEGPAARDVGLPAAVTGPSAPPAGQCDLRTCVDVDLGIGNDGVDVTAVRNADPDAAPAAAAPAPAAQPRARAPRPDPVAVARRSVANLRLKTVTPGSTPLEPGSISIVGVPTWMWAENANALGAVTDTASVPGLSLTMTAKLTGVTWDMGDGTVIECEGTGTKWSPDLGTGDSPTCGHTYTTQGTRTVTSTAHWSVTWRASTGQTGVITRDLPSTSTIRVGEVQVINSKPTN